MVRVSITQQRPKSRLPRMRLSQPLHELVVRFEILVVPNLRIQTINLTDMPRGVLVACGTALTQRDLDERASEQNCGQWVFSFNDPSRWIKQFVAVAVDFSIPREQQLSGTLVGRPFDQKGQRRMNIGMSTYTRNEMTGTTVTLHLHWRKQNQHVMNQQLSTSISGKPVAEILVGEGARAIARAGEGYVSAEKRPLIRHGLPPRHLLPQGEKEEGGAANPRTPQPHDLQGEGREDRSPLVRLNAQLTPPPPSCRRWSSAWRIRRRH